MKINNAKKYIIKITLIAITVLFEIGCGNFYNDILNQNKIPISLLSNQIALSSKEITSFSIIGYNNYNCLIDEDNKTIVVGILVGRMTDMTAALHELRTAVATFSTSGSSVKVGNTIQISGVTQNDFTKPVSYVVAAADNSTVNYTVTIQFFVLTP